MEYAPDKTEMEKALRMNQDFKKLQCGNGQKIHK